MLEHAHGPRALAHDRRDVADAQVAEDPEQHHLGLIPRQGRDPRERILRRDSASASSSTLRRSACLAISAGAAGWVARRARRRRRSMSRLRAIVNAHARNARSSPSNRSMWAITLSHTSDARSSPSTGSSVRRYRRIGG